MGRKLHLAKGTVSLSKSSWAPRAPNTPSRSMPGGGRRRGPPCCVVGVVTRHPRGVRGVITGTVLTYDVHMNMILQDCAESYSELHLFRDEAKGRFRRKQKHFTRRMKQVMLKGDSVVLLHKVAETRLLPPGGEGAPPG